MQHLPVGCAMLASAVRFSRGLASVAILHVPPAEAALDAEIAPRDVVFVRRGDLHDLVVLDMQRERAADAAIGADRVDLTLGGLVPLTRAAAVVLRLEHQCAGGTDGD